MRVGAWVRVDGVGDRVDGWGMRDVRFSETQWMVRNPWFAWVPALFFVMYTSGYGALALRGAATDTDLVLWVLTGVVLPAVLCSWRLRTQVLADEAGVVTVEVSLPPVPGLRWSAAGDEIQMIEAMRRELPRQMNAFGLRRELGTGWIWHAFGSDAVRVTTQNAADRYVGTQRVEDLMAALRAETVASDVTPAIAA